MYDVRACRHILSRRRFSDPQTGRKTLTLLIISEVPAELAAVKQRSEVKQRLRVSTRSSKQESPSVTHRCRRSLISDGRFRHSRFSFTKSSSISLWVHWPKRAILASGTIQSANLNMRWSKRKSRCRKMNSQSGTLQPGPKREGRGKHVATAGSGSPNWWGNSSRLSRTFTSRGLRVEPLGRQQFVIRSSLRMLHWSYLLICSLFC